MGEEIEVRVGSEPGKTVAIFSGVHGNEKAGIIAMKKVIKEIKLKRGRVYFVLANPPAVKRNVRMINKNLNRLFFKENNGKTWEDQRARELMKLLDDCEALLDIHGYNGPEDKPFVITEKEGYQISNILNFDYLLTGMGKMGKGGTDYYMTTRGKVGICAECGSNERPEQYASLAEDTIYKFLSFFDLIERKNRLQPKKKSIYRVVSINLRTNDNFSFSRNYKTFDKLASGRVFAIDGGREYVAKDNQYIIFPRPNQEVGKEAFILAEKSVIPTK